MSLTESELIYNVKLFILKKQIFNFIYSTVPSLFVSSLLLLLFKQLQQQWVLKVFKLKLYSFADTHT